MSTHQQTWSTASHLPMSAGATYADNQQPAMAMDMDFSTILDSMNTNDQTDMAEFGFTAFDGRSFEWPVGGNNSDVKDFSSASPAFANSATSSSHPATTDHTVKWPVSAQMPTSLPHTVFEGQVWDPQQHNYVQRDAFTFGSIQYDNQPFWQPPIQNYRQMSPYGSHRALPEQRDPVHDANIIWPGPEQGSLFQQASEFEDIDSADTSDPCYAQLLYRCLKEAPDHTMSLKELYEWVSQNSKKASDPSNKGWQNSVRHNLSMNKAFERVSPSANHGQKKGSLWRLSEKALRHGVISTTRYRKDPKHKVARQSSPAFKTLKRQISGSKGGQATRRAAVNARQQATFVRSVPSSTVAKLHRRYQETHQTGYFSPTSAYSSRAPSPRDDMIVQTAPSSPYFFSVEQQSLSPPAPIFQTSPQLETYCNAEGKGLLPTFNFQHIDLAKGGLFGNYDDVAPDTPSLTSETSLANEDGLFMLSQQTSREATIF